MQESSKHEDNKIKNDHKFTGNIYIFHAFDVGDDINFEKIEKSRKITTLPLQLPKYFKKYHTPLAVELPHPHESARCMSSKIHNFGAISLTYKIPFTDSLTNLRKEFTEINNQYLEQSVADVKTIYKRIENNISQPRFFHTRASYIIIQIDPVPELMDITQLQKQYGETIASTLRFETESLSESQIKEILNDAIGYFRGDLIVIDTDASFIYDDEHEELLGFFEFANIQQLALRYFDELLDRKLNKMYEAESGRLPLKAYLPFLGMLTSDPVVDLGKLKVDISVITERLEGTVKFAGEPYLYELYQLLVEKLDLKNWQNAIERKLTIVHDIQSMFQHKTDIIREDILSVLIIVLIFIELVIGILSYLK